MGQILANFPDVSPVSVTYPYGNIKDDTGANDGTPFSVQTMADIYQLLQRMAAQSGITLNDLPDNAANSFQFSQAFGGEAWTSGGSLTYTVTSGGGTFVATNSYNKYRRVGKTIEFQLNLGATVTGTVDGVFIRLPFLPNAWANINNVFLATSNGSTLYRVQLFTYLGNFGLLLYPDAGGSFATGGGQEYKINVTGEV